MANELKGKRCAVTGALVGMTRSEAMQKLKAVGALAVKSVSTKTDYLIAGSGAGSKIQKASAAGVRVINQEQFEALLEGGTLEKLEELEPEVEEIEIVPLEDALSLLRGLIYEKPSKELWYRICELLEQCSDEDLEVALDYVTQTTSHWPTKVTFNSWGLSWQEDDEHRASPQSWVEDILNARDHPRHRIVRVLNLAGRDLVGKVANHIFECPHLSNVTYLQLSRNAKLPGTFYTKLRTSEQFSNVTHLNLADSKISSASAKAFVGESALHSLTHASLHHTRFARPEDLKLVLSQPIWQNLTYLDVSYARMQDYSGANEAIAEGLLEGQFDKLTHLDVHACSIGQNGVYVPFLADPKWQHLTYLNVGSNELTAEYVHDLAKASYLSQLKTLNVSYMQCGIAAAEALLSATHWGALESIDLTRTTIGDKGLRAILNNESFGNLKKLGLYEVGCSEELAIELLHTPHLGKVTALNLGESKVGRGFIEALLNATHYDQLETLQVHPVELTNRIWQEIANTPHFKNIQYMYLGGNHKVQKKTWNIIKKSKYLSETCRNHLLANLHS